VTIGLDKFCQQNFEHNSLRLGSEHYAGRILHFGTEFEHNTRKKISNTKDAYQFFLNALFLRVERKVTKTLW